MSPSTETSSTEGGEGRITVQRLAPIKELTTPQIIRAVRHALGRQPLGTMSVALVDDTTMAALHERYMGDADPTDVLSFDLRDDASAAIVEGQTPIEGEIVVSVDTARRHANRLGIALSTEVLRYVIHGMLHLLALDDRTRVGRSRMRRAENRLLKGLVEQPGLLGQQGRTHRGARCKQRRKRSGA